MAESEDKTPATGVARVAEGAAGPPVAGPFPPELIRLFLENQGKEIAVRADEIALRQRQLVNAHEFSQKSLEAQAQDRRETRQGRRTARRDRLLFAGFVIVVVAGFVVYALSIGKEQFAIEALRQIGYVSAGVLTGYAIRALREPPKPPDARP
jgi:hypothetical protein